MASLEDQLLSLCMLSLKSKIATGWAQGDNNLLKPKTSKNKKTGEVVDKQS